MRFLRLIKVKNTLGPYGHLKNFVFQTNRIKGFESKEIIFELYNDFRADVLDALTFLILLKNSPGKEGIEA